MSLSSDIQKVAIVGLPNNYLNAEYSNVNLDTQLVKTIHTEGTLFVLDSLRSQYNRNGFSVNTTNLFQHYNRLRLSEVAIQLNIPTINKYNKTVKIKLEQIGTPTEIISFVLAEGYYTDLDIFIAMFSTALNFAIEPYAATFNLKEHLVSTLLFDVSRMSVIVNSPDYKKIKIETPLKLNPALDETFISFIECDFLKSKLLCPFPVYDEIKQTGKIYTTDDVINSGVCQLIYSRYLYILCDELTASQRIASFDGENSINNLVAIINLRQSSQASYDILGITNEYTINTKAQNLNILNIYISDEFNNILDFGFDIDNIVYDNQIKLVFIAHD